jgi:hypothetical protein
LVILVPEAEPVVGELRARHDPAAAVGVPAHVTILYPFVPAPEVTDTLRREIGELVRHHAAFEYRFRSLERFDDGTVYLVPEPAATFRELTAAFAARWPDYPPYGGVHADVIPHLTVGEALGARADSVQAAASGALQHHGPVQGRATAIVLMAGDARGMWSVDSRHPLRAAA